MDPNAQKNIRWECAVDWGSFSPYRTEADLAINIRKATNIGEFVCPLLWRRNGTDLRAVPWLFILCSSCFTDYFGQLTEETAPKRKHVRACIVYTWDNRSSAAFWAGMKVLVYHIFVNDLFCSHLRYALCANLCSFPCSQTTHPRR